MTIKGRQAFLDAAAPRRSVYAINDEKSPLSQAEIESIVKRALEICPSPWNISSSCCVILFGANHKKLWNDIVLSAMHNTLPSGLASRAEGRIRGFAAGLGTVLFFENQDALAELKKRQAMVAPLAEPWSNVVSGMLQHTVWSALSIGEMGCSLQHYDWSDDVVDEVRKEFGVPEPWKLKAQLVFGNKYQEPGERRFKPAQTIDERLKVVAYPVDSLGGLNGVES